ncbi:unnamed protein product, partial [marine sediment metagenome]
GEFRVTLSASDEAGNIATDSIYLELDNIPPDAISIERPCNGDAIRCDLTIFTIHDGETPDEDVESFVLQIRSPQVRYFDAPQQSPGHWNSGGSSSITWDATTVVEETYDFRVVVTDTAGNVFITSPVTVEVDDTPPEITHVDVDIAPPEITGLEKDFSACTRSSVLTLLIQVRNQETGCHLIAYFSAMDDQ